MPTSLSAPGIAGGAHKSQLLVVLIEALQTQQVQMATLRAPADAATVAFEQRLRQLEAASIRPGFWR